MMKKSKATKIAKLWNEQHEGRTAATKTIAVVCDCGKCGYDVDIRPADTNTGTAFYSIEELADFSRVFHVNNIIWVRNGIVVGKFF